VNDEQTLRAAVRRAAGVYGSNGVTVKSLTSAYPTNGDRPEWAGGRLRGVEDERALSSALIKRAHVLTLLKLAAMPEWVQRRLTSASVDKAEPMQLFKMRGDWIEKADERRYTLAPMYEPDTEDAHGEFVAGDTLETAVWRYVQRNDRTLYLQHTKARAGEWVNIVCWPFPVEAKLMMPTGESQDVTFPPGTIFLGVIWDEETWPLVKSGKITGYSLGGTAKRVEVSAS
jgi:hypothetical protein